MPPSPGCQRGATQAPGQQRSGPGHLAQVDLQVEAYVAPERMESRIQVTARAGSLGPRALGQSVDEEVKQELEALVCVTVGEVIG